LILFKVFTSIKALMKKEIKRRDFVATCLKAGVTCCALAYGTSLSAFDPAKRQDTKPDPKNLEYCGYKCPADCPLKKATLENNLDLKKKAYVDFKFKEKYGIEFDADKVFCYGCKIKDKPLGMSVKACTVRKCAIEKGYECCIQCDGLATCDKELWTNFPKFKDIVIEMQKKYKAA
jgi:hypothetical protein